MKKTLITLALAVLASVSALAQTNVSTQAASAKNASKATSQAVATQAAAQSAATAEATEQPTIKNPVISAVRQSTGDGQVRLEAVLVNKGEAYLGKVNTRIIHRVTEPDRIINRIIAETINYERITDGETIIQTFNVHFIPAQGAEYYARTVVFGPDGSENVTETPFSFTNVE